ncbi:PREDICTED: tryptophan--tRNA ligase, mitochondrial-like isoform X2 [Amphimedon queenslandica]|uniref:Tryptophan--tRNA ligase, mitochondrial n=1 Tax=Amphimedon queenslandica TaxID=400682 RepID=A0AAN0J3S6_AMPQE|nr:PREDICTED: tryptophan--tRNA ligase, mitochondrial-like isoform X2 [Amphimedon queenslandica]|eukprot:XP_019851391.1 PREDICTED: tryptophan--tRNA ligase, mitochondrial-like isoform X2 [Amphimedon queenslandica]
MAGAQRVFSGIQPSGVPHLGNYIGAIRNWVQLQKTCGNNVMYSIVDLHALTVHQAPLLLKRNIKNMTVCLLACGIDPKQSIVFQQSQVPEHCELMWLLSCQTPNGWLNKMTQWKSKGATDNKSFVNIGLYAYPILMAADILLYKATHIPVGADQLQHLELTCDIAHTFNSRYGVEFFPKPQPLLSEGKNQRIMSLRNPLQKMSKSDNQEMARIDITDTPDQVHNKIRKAVTDCTSAVTFEPEERPGVSNLVSMYSALSGKTTDEVVEDFTGKETVELKDGLTQVIMS